MSKMTTYAVASALMISSTLVALAGFDYSNNTADIPLVFERPGVARSEAVLTIDHRRIAQLDDVSLDPKRIDR